MIILHHLHLQMTPPDVSGQEISVGATDGLEAAGEEMPDQYNHLAQKQMTDARNQVSVNTRSEVIPILYFLYLIDLNKI